MTTFNTGNPIGSTDARDLSDNAKNMDYLENSTTELTHADRLGTVRKTRHGMEVEHDNQIAAHEAEHDAQMQSFENDFDGRLAGMAFTRVGTFAAGYTLTNMRQTLEYSGHEYSWAGTFPKVVAASSAPETTGGIGAGAWVDRTDIILREHLAATTGAGLIGTTGGDTVQAKLDALDAVSSVLSFTVDGVSSVLSFANDTGIANAYVVGLTPALTARSEGQVIKFKVANTNSGASTINDGLGVVPLVGGAHAALQGGELVAGGGAWAQWNSSVGTGSYVLLFCSAAPLQVADGSKSKHALTLGQLTGSIGASSGWKKQPFLDASDGLVKQLMEQWGVATVSVTSSVGGAFAVTLPVAFTTAIHHISANLRSNTVITDNVSAYAYPTSLGTITLVLDAPGAAPFPTGTYYIYWRVQGV